MDVEATVKASTSAANTGSSGLEAFEQPDVIAVDEPSSTSAVVPVKQTEVCYIQRSFPSPTPLIRMSRGRSIGLINM